jgi:NADPH-dependent ferric siderophore reductase
MAADGTSGARTLSTVTELPRRREPPQFRAVEVARVVERSPSLRRLTLSGPALAGFELALPAASVRLLLPPTGTNEVVSPTWNGNEFLFDGGERPIIRTLTPLRFDPRALELDVEVVRHGHGPLSAWAAAARPGDRGAVSGPGRGYAVDPDAPTYLVAGDESALPAITQLIPLLPPAADVLVVVEVDDLSSRIDLPDHPRLREQWHERPADARAGDALVEAVLATTLDPEVRVWAAGEAAAVQRIRRHLFDDVGLTRSRAVVRGYWKHGRGGDPED